VKNEILDAGFTGSAGTECDATIISKRAVKHNFDILLNIETSNELHIFGDNFQSFSNNSSSLPSGSKT